MDPDLSMSRRSLPRLFGGVFGLAAFVVVVISGLLAHNSASHVLIQAIVALVAANIIGSVFGMIAEGVVRDHARRYADANPVPVFTPPTESAEPDGPAEVARDEEPASEAA